jgi:amino acid transporter/nucleotide-binding universal stress UspA family protein
MIGAEIFVLTGIAAGVAGPALLISFLLNGMVTLFTAMAYAELGSCFHTAGGAYLWVKEGLPQPSGFLAGWMSWFAHAVACSLYALGFGAYFGHVITEGFGWDPHGLPFPLEKFLAVVACLIFAYINFRGASETGKAGVVVTIAKVIVIGLFVAFGVAVIAHKAGWQAEFTPFMPAGYAGVFMAMGLTFIAFQGYEVIAQCSEEIIDPKRNVPRAIFIALAIVIPIYLLVVFVALGAISGNGVPTWQYLGEYKEIAMVEAARQFMPGGAVLFLIGGLLSTVSALNATIYSSSRVAFAMARDANLPDFVARVHDRRRTPHLSIVASTVIIVLMAVALPIEDVASAADLMFLFLFMMVNIVVIRLRKKRPDLDRGFRIPLLPVIPLIGIATQVLIGIYLVRYSPKAVLSAGIWIALGALTYYTYASKKESAVVGFREALRKLAQKEYQILVSIGNEENIKPLMSFALALAKRFDGEIVALSVVEVAHQTPLESAAGLPEIKEKRTLLRRAERMADAEGVPCRRLIKVTHRLSQGILETAQEEDCNFIVLGRSPRPRLGSRVVRSMVDRVLDEATCHVAVVKSDGMADVRKVAVAVEEGPHSRLAQELAPAVAERWKAEVAALPGAQSADEILGEVGESDVLLVGDAPWSGWTRMLAPALPDLIVEKSKQTVVLIKSYQPKRKRSLLVRLLTGK